MHNMRNKRQMQQMRREKLGNLCALGESWAHSRVPLQATLMLL